MVTLIVRRRLPFSRVLRLSFLGAALASTLAAQAQSSMQQEAKAAAVRPVRIDVRPSEQGARAGEAVLVEVVLRDNYNRPVGATVNTPVRVTVVFPSGKEENRQITLKAGEFKKELEFQTREVGPAKLTVKHENDSLLGGSNYVLIRPSGKGTEKPSAAQSMKFQLIQFERAAPAALRTATLPPTATATLLLRVSGEQSDEVRANGKAYARVQVFYMGDNTLKAPVKVFLAPSQGALGEAAVTVDPATSAGEVHWTSTVIDRNAVIRVVRVVPDNLSIEPLEAKASFVEPILGVKLVNPPASISLVDAPSLTARFFDDDGNAVNTTVKRHISFVSNNPILRVTPEEDEVGPNRAEFRTVLQPASWGRSTIEVATPGYQSASHPIEVTVFTILLLCVAGGLLGGIASYWNSKSKSQLAVRLLGGVIVALAASWVYVFIGIPKLDSGIAHTQISVLFVSLLAAFAGLGALKAMSKAVGINL